MKPLLSKDLRTLCSQTAHDGLLFLRHCIIRRMLNRLKSAVYAVYTAVSQSHYHTSQHCGNSEHVPMRSLSGLEPRRTLGVGRLQLDVELLQRLVERRLIPREVRRDCVVKQQQLFMHHLHLATTHTRWTKKHSSNNNDNHLTALIRD